MYVSKGIDYVSLSNIKKITMTTSLDIEGGKKRILPKQIAGKNKQGIDETDYVETA